MAMISPLTVTHFLMIPLFIQVSKEVKKLWQFEDSLLRHYKYYFQYLLDTIRRQLQAQQPGNRHTSLFYTPAVDDIDDDDDNDMETPRKRSKHSAVEMSTSSSSSSSSSSLVYTCVKCLCELALAGLYFNFRSDLISALVPLLNNTDTKVRFLFTLPPSLPPSFRLYLILLFYVQISEMCCAAVRKIFAVDNRGEASLEIVRAISKLIKTKLSRSLQGSNTRLPSRISVGTLVVDVLLSLNLQDSSLPSDDILETATVSASSLGRHGGAAATSSGGRKKNKRSRELEREFNEAEAVHSKRQRSKTVEESLGSLSLSLSLAV